MIVATVPTVQWRWESSALPMLKTLAGQVDLVFVHAHGFTPPLDDVRAIGDHAIVHEFGLRPSGHRWDVLEQLADTDIVLSLDDDFVLATDYTDRTVRELRRLGGCVSWYGMRPPGDSGLSWTANAPDDVPLISLGTGMCATFVGNLRGMVEHQEAPKILRAHDGDEEGFVSWWLFARGHQLWRPRGVGPLAAHANQDDPRALYHTHAKHIATWRPYLRRTYGWPWGGQGWAG